MNRIGSVFSTISIIVFCTPVFSACDTVVAGDGVLVFGDAATSPEFTNFQDAINMARECEFQIPSFTTQSTSVANVLAGGVVSNLDEANTPWKGGVDEIEDGDLIQFNNGGKWYEIASATSGELILTRDVELAVGGYTYVVTKPMTIAVSQGSYLVSEKLDFSGIHYLSLVQQAESGYVKPMIQLTKRSDFKNAPDYGHLTINGLQLISSSEALLFFGNPLTGSTSAIDIEHDIDLTILNSVLMNTNGNDVIKSNYHGDIVIENSHMQSKNDVIFLPYSNSFDEPRSVTIDNSVFISSARVGGDIDPGNKKVLSIVTRENGDYSISNSVVSVYKQPNGSPRGYGVKVVSNSSANVSIDNINVVCNACAGTINSTAPIAGIIMEGAGGAYTVSNSQILVDSASCGITAAFGAVVSSVNNSWASSAAPYCTHEGGIIY